jgi:phosphoethanolamine N-methyltransferase
MTRGMSVLDIGSGLGGAAFYFAEHYQASVLGLDVAPAMVEISRERAAEQGANDVRFMLGDVRSADLPQDHFDLGWTRDCILYVPEKNLVWNAAFRAIKPGGHLFITDFCRRPEPLSAEFADYLEQTHYHLQTIDEYRRALVAAGFEVSTAEDATPEFIACMEREQNGLAASRERFLQTYTEADYTYLATRWDKKLKFCRDGEFRWGLFIARKPARQ